MQFIDTHIHLQDFKAEYAPQVLANDEARRLVLVAAAREDFAKIAALLRRYPAKLGGAFGLHPWYWREETPIAELEAYLQEFPQAAVGEIGVDGLREPPSDGQHALFEAQLKTAEAFGYYPRGKGFCGIGGAQSGVEKSAVCASRVCQESRIAEVYQ